PVGSRSQEQRRSRAVGNAPRGHRRRICAHRIAQSRLHALLLFSESDAHLFQGHLIERASELKAFGLLVFFQTRASISAELTSLLAGIEPSLLQNGLRLFDLIRRRAKDRTSLRRGFSVVVRCRSI